MSNISDIQIIRIMFLITGIFLLYKGTKLLYQCIQYDQQITWYKRVRLTGGIYWLLLGLGLVILNGTELVGVPMPFGDMGNWILPGIAVLMFLFGALSLRYKPRT